MNRVITAITITAISAILLAWAPSTAYAGVDNMPAMVLKEDGQTCFIPLDAGSSVVVPADTLTQVANKHHAMLNCHAFDVPNTTGSAYKFDLDIECILFTGYGAAVGTCTIVVSQHDNGTTGDALLKFKGEYI